MALPLSHLVSWEGEANGDYEFHFMWIDSEFPSMIMSMAENGIMLELPELPGRRFIIVEWKVFMDDPPFTDVTVIGDTRRHYLANPHPQINMDLQCREAG